MKTFKVKPAEVFALQFTDGKKIKISLAGPDFFSSIIYAGAKSINPDFTEEEANALYVQLEDSCPDALNGIIEEYCNASGVDGETLKKNAVMKILGL